jgi:hypothetical protein
MKRYYVRYLEARNDLEIMSSPTFVMRTSFDAGERRGRSNGHQTKRAALEWIEKVNRAAGKPIAEYAGAFEPQT